MIVSQTRNFVFFHIPKTAGTSVSFSLSTLIDQAIDTRIGRKIATDASHVDAGFEPGATLKKHASPDELMAVWDQARYDRAFRFAFVRNPFARLFSGFQFLKKTALNPDLADKLPDRIKAYDILSFDDAMATIADRKSAHYAFYEQMHWFSPAAKYHFVGRAEYMDADLARIWRHLAPDVKFPAQRAKLNVSTSHDAWRSMSTASRDMIVQHYAQDFARLGYSTDLDAQAPPPFSFAPGAVRHDAPVLEV